MNVLWPSENSILGHIDEMQRLLDDDMLVTKLEKGAKNLSRHFRWDKIAAEYDLAIRQGCL